MAAHHGLGLRPCLRYSYPNGWGSSIPSEVVEAIRHKFAPDTELAEKIISSLQYDNVSGNWYFYHAGMYHGVEADGSHAEITRLQHQGGKP